MTQHRALTQAIRRRMALTGEKYTEARRALQLQRERSVGAAGERATMLAEGEVGGWPWVFAASEFDDASGRRIVYTVHHRDRKGTVWAHVQLGEFPVHPRFFQNPEGDASVLCGPVAEDVSAVFVEPGFPVRRPAKQASIVSAAGLGRFFVIAFGETIEQANVRVEPGERFTHPAGVAVNVQAENRRRTREGVEVGRGPTPGGGRWRLRVWRARPDELRVDLLIANDDAEIDGPRKGGSGAGYGGPATALDQPVSCRRMSGPLDTAVRHIVGEITSNVNKVRLLLDDGGEINAQLVRTDYVQNDYFVAFLPDDRLVVALTALDKEDQELGQQDIPTMS